MDAELPAEILRIDRRFCGPPYCANGGYVAGRLARILREGTEGNPTASSSPAPSGEAARANDPPEAIQATDRTIEVWIHRPVPLQKPLGAVLVGGDVELRDGTELLATARPGEIRDPPPRPVDWTTADAARSRYRGIVDHPFPTCYVCGPLNAHGLRLAPGPVEPGRVATPWRPCAVRGQPEDDGTPERSGVVPTELVWAALDCPGGWSCDIAGRPMVLGRLCATIRATPHFGEELVIVGELRGQDGRKVFTASALYDREGQLLANAEATWLVLR
ncbi:MAG: hypothetical protein IRZ02_02830 [Acidothermus sp.]|nr:hypothetical protein [Acidothermus sp.]MCL6538582.1 hypothetical protein [Acidothermus sp.]